MHRDQTRSLAASLQLKIQALKNFYKYFENNNEVSGSSDIPIKVVFIGQNVACWCILVAYRNKIG